MWPRPCGAQRTMCLRSSDSRLALMRWRWLSHHRGGSGIDILKLNPEVRLFINGALVGAEDGQTYNVINPATEEVAGDRALAAARRCFDQCDWPTNRTRRLKAVTQFRDGLKVVAEEWRQ